MQCNLAWNIFMATLRKVCVGLRIILLLQSVECIFLGIIVFKCLFSWAINNFRAKIVLVICRKWFVDAEKGVPLSSSQIALHRWSELSWKPENLSGPVNAGSYLRYVDFVKRVQLVKLETGWRQAEPGKDEPQIVTGWWGWSAAGSSIIFHFYLCTEYNILQTGFVLFCYRISNYLTTTSVVPFTRGGKTSLHGAAN